MKNAICHPIKLPFDAEAAERILKVIQYSGLMVSNQESSVGKKSMVNDPLEHGGLETSMIRAKKLHSKIPF